MGLPPREVTPAHPKKPRTLSDSTAGILALPASASHQLSLRKPSTQPLHLPCDQKKNKQPASYKRTAEALSGLPSFISALKIYS